MSIIPQTECCIVGAGPAGVMLSYLLARQGIRVVLFEAQRDFDRDFRGDVLSPAILEVLESLGLIEEFLYIPHNKINKLVLVTPTEHYASTDFSLLNTRYPYLLNVKQSVLLNFLVEKALHYPEFQLITSSRVTRLLEENGIIRGVGYRTQNGEKQLHSKLVVATDGRFSQLRKLAALKPRKIFSNKFDVLWFRLPKEAGDVPSINVNSYFGERYYFCIADRDDYWQISYQIPKGAFATVREKGIEQFRLSITKLLPELKDKVEVLKDWSAIKFLKVEINHLPRWYRPGLLFLGDAAHTMSSIGGFGVSCAVQDAICASNILTPSLHRGKVKLSDLARIQRKRKWITLMMQALQFIANQSLIAKALRPGKVFNPPRFFRTGMACWISTYLTAYGLGRQDTFLAHRP